MQRNYFWQFREIFLFGEGAFELGSNCDVLDIEIMIFPPNIIFEGSGTQMKFFERGLPGVFIAEEAKSSKQATSICFGSNEVINFC